MTRLTRLCICQVITLKNMLLSLRCFTFQNCYIPTTEYSIYKNVYLYNVSFKLNMECSNEDIITYVKCDVGGLNLNTTVNINCPPSGEIFFFKVLNTIKYMNEKPIRYKKDQFQSFFIIRHTYILRVLLQFSYDNESSVYERAMHDNLYFLFFR